MPLLISLFRFQYDGSVAIKINSTTGELRVTPDTKGQFVVGILVKEYRNGVLIGQVLRDYQFNVEECIFSVQANFENPPRVCKDTVRFKDLSNSAVKYSWDFGETNISKDTSNIPNPKWFYTKSGKYRVTLIVENDVCVDTFYNWVTVAETDIIDAKFKVAPNIACDELNVTIEDLSDTSTNWHWNMGDGTGNRYLQNIKEYRYTQEGAYQIKLVIIDSLKCNITDSMTQIVRVINTPIADFDLDTSECSGVTVFTNKSSGTSEFLWDYGTDSIPNSEEKEETIKYKKSGKYVITLIAKNGPCADTATKEADVFVGYDIAANASASPLIGCLPLEVNVMSSRLLGQYNTWTMGDGSTFNNKSSFDYSYTKEGEFKILYVVEDSLSCNKIDSLSFIVKTKHKPYSEFDYDFDVCSGIGAFYNNSTEAETYSWDLGNGKYSNEDSPEFKYKKTGTYKVILIADSGSICPDTAEVDVVVDINDVRDLKLYNAFSPNGDQYNNCFGFEGLDENCVDITIKIYNRWGMELFTSSDINACWDGINPLNDQPYPDGTYFVLYYLENKSTGEKNTISGTIKLLE